MASEKTKNFLTIKTKAEILDKIASGCGTIALAKEYGVAKSTISGFKKRKEKIINSVSKSSYINKNRKTLKRGEYPKMEEALHKWFVAEKYKIKNAFISGAMLKEKAKELHHELCVGEGGFFASSNWLCGFKKRYGIRLLDNLSEKYTNLDDELPRSKEYAEERENLLTLTVKENKTGTYYVDFKERSIYFTKFPMQKFKQKLRFTKPA